LSSVSSDAHIVVKLEPVPNGWSTPLLPISSSATVASKKRKEPPMAPLEDVKRMKSVEASNGTSTGHSGHGGDSSIGNGSNGSSSISSSSSSSTKDSESSLLREIYRKGSPVLSFCGTFRGPLHFSIDPSIGAWEREDYRTRADMIQLPQWAEDLSYRVFCLEDDFDKHKLGGSPCIGKNCSGISILIHRPGLCRECCDLLGK
jgi:hypothetical protein